MINKFFIVVAALAYGFNLISSETATVSLLVTIACILLEGQA